LARRGYINRETKIIHQRCMCINGMLCSSVCLLCVVVVGGVNARSRKTSLLPKPTKARKQNNNITRSLCGKNSRVFHSQLEQKQAHVHTTPTTTTTTTHHNTRTHTQQKKRPMRASMVFAAVCMLCTCVYTVCVCVCCCLCVLCRVAKRGKKTTRFFLRSKPARTQSTITAATTQHTAQRNTAADARSTDKATVCVCLLLCVRCVSCVMCACSASRTAERTACFANRHHARAHAAEATRAHAHATAAATHKT
jgi:hypothetical protein